VEWENHSYEGPPLVTPSIETEKNSYQGFQKPPVLPLLPTYIRSLPPNLTSEDLTFLKTKRVLDVPGRPLRNALLRNYVDYVHPFLPIIDLEDFLQAIQTGGASGSVSLLLFQAVIFAAIPFIDDSVLVAAGVDRTELRKTYFERARVSLLFKP